MFIYPSAVAFAALTCSFVLLGCAGSQLKAAEAPESRGAAEAAASPARGTAPTAETKPTTPAASALADAARALTGTWSCNGTVHGPHGPSPSQVTLEIGLDLDQAWLRTRFAVSSGEYHYAFDAHRTFDTAKGQWVNVIVDNVGGHALSASTDSVTWLGESSGPMGTMQIKDTETLVAPGQVNMVGQYSFDGTTWNTGYELSCKKAEPDRPAMGTGTAMARDRKSA